MFYRDRIDTMIINCPKCKTRLTFPDEKLKPEGTKFRCSKCGTTLLYKGKGRQAPQGETPEAPAPPPSYSPAEHAPMTPQTLSAPRGEHPHEDVSPSRQARPADIPYSGGAAVGAKTERKQEDVRKTDDVSQPVPAHSSAVYSGGAGEEKKAAPVKAIIAAAGGLLILVLVAIFFFNSGGKAPSEQMKAAVADKGMTTSPPSSGAGTASTENSPENAAAGLPASPSEDAASAKGPAATTEEEAIEAVKRSDALLKRTSVESIVKVWTEKNAANYRVVGWQAKKTDEQKYLVSYTALDGDMPKGFYFELDAQSGVVVDLGRNPDLQKKYNIKYAK